MKIKDVRLYIPILILTGTLFVIAVMGSDSYPVSGNSAMDSVVPNPTPVPIKKRPIRKAAVKNKPIPPRDPNRYTVIGDVNPPPPLATEDVPNIDGDAPRPPPPPPRKQIAGTISGGILNGKATSLVKPAYPPAARAVEASGSVTVEILVNEQGNVVSASAVSGHPLLRAAAAQAARQAKFSPTMLSGVPVKVSGTIVYNFVP